VYEERVQGCGTLNRKEPRVLKRLGKFIGGNEEASLPQCPRCGYDLSGITATWDAAGACPLVSVCSECGLDVRWSRVIGADRDRLLWLVETRQAEPVGWMRRGRWWAYRCATTLERLAVPSTFYRRVTLETAVRPRRLCAWLLSLVIAAQFVGFVAGFVPLIEAALWAATGRLGVGLKSRVVEWPLDEALTQFTRPWLMMHYSGLAPTTVYIRTFIHDSHPGLWAPAVAALFVPLVMLLLRDSRKLARVRGLHVLRSFIYSMAPLLFLTWVYAAVHLCVGATLAMDILIHGPQWRGDNGMLRKAYQLINQWGAAFGCIVVIWNLWYWWAVMKLGWRLSEVGLIYVLLMVQYLLVSWSLMVIGELSRGRGWDLPL